MSFLTLCFFNSFISFIFKTQGWRWAIRLYNDGLPVVKKFFIIIIKTKVFLRLYLFYLSSSVIVWLYPTLLSCFGLTQEKSPISLNILSTIFLFGLLLVIFILNRRNKKVNREILIEEIKKEVMDEFNKSQ